MNITRATSLRAFLRALATMVGTLAISAPAIAQDTVVYFHTDAVGSVRMVTNASATVLDRYDYLPFGEDWPSPPSGTERVRFTGQERDTETGFDYLASRYLAANNGRFSSPDDPAYSDPFDPQSLNLYAYAYNNPLRLIDPTGHEPQCAFDACVKAPLPPSPPPSRPISDFVYGWAFSWWLDPISTSAQAPGFGEENAPLQGASAAETAGALLNPYGLVRRGAVSMAARATGPFFKTGREAAAAAATLGFTRTNYRVSGQAVYTNGKIFISRDADGHAGGAWKVANSVKDLGSKTTRTGTFSADLSTKVGD